MPVVRHQIRGNQRNLLIGVVVEDPAGEIIQLTPSFAGDQLNRTGVRKRFEITIIPQQPVGLFIIPAQAQHVMAQQQHRRVELFPDASGGDVDEIAVRIHHEIAGRIVAVIGLDVLLNRIHGGSRPVHRIIDEHPRIIPLGERQST